MKYPGILISTASLVLALSASNLYAEKHDHGAHDHGAPEEHRAHEHGAAKLSLAVGEKGVDIMLESPAANIVGFEHAASTDADKQTLAAAKQKLEAGADLFAFNTAAGCTLTSAKVVSALLDKLDNLDNAKAAKHDDHKHKGDATHNDMDVTWAFTCTTPTALSDVTTKLFAAFPDGFQHIKAEWVTPKGASAVALKKDDTIKLTP